MIGLWVLLSFLSGSLPFSVWVGRFVLHKDIRHYGDGNPGSFNVFRAGGRFWGVTAVLLDFLKGVIPVSLAYFRVGMEGWELTAVALAPILGHAFSPFLKFRGGKALAVTFGVWCGLSLWVIPTVLGIFFAIWLNVTKVGGRAVLLGLLSLLPVLLLLDAPWEWYVVWWGNTLILAWKHCQEVRASEEIKGEG